MSTAHMPTNLRLTEWEQEELRKKAIQINKILVAKGLQPLRDSEIAHKILEKTIRYAEVGESGEIIVITP